MEPDWGRPSICIGGGPDRRWDRVTPGGADLLGTDGEVEEEEGSAGAEDDDEEEVFCSSPDTSARPFTFRFSAVFRRDDSLSWEGRRFKKVCSYVNCSCYRPSLKCFYL